MPLPPPAFPLGTPASGRDLVGRDEAVAELALRLSTGQHLLLFGPRRTGKTSVAEAALARLRAGGLLGARVDLTYTPSKRALADALAGACLQVAGTGFRALEQLRAALASVRPELRLRRELGPEAAEFVLGLARPDTRPDAEDEVLRSALALPERVAATRGRRAILCLDEFQEAGRIDTGIYRLIRAEISAQRHTTYLFMGSQGSLLSGLFARRNEPLYQFATVWSLPPVPAEAWTAYLAARYAEAGLSTTAAGLDALLAASGAHPMHTMLLAQEAAVLALTDRGVVDADIAGAARASAARALAPAFEEVWRSLPAPAQTALILLSRGDSPWTGRGSRTTKRAMDALLDRGILVRAGRGRYRFFETMFEEFVRGIA